MKIELLFTGDELLDGRVLNTNEKEISTQLSAIGFEVIKATTVGDDRIRLKAAFESCISSADMVIMTGGLGPTEDDRTAEILSAITGKPLTQYPEAIQHLESFYVKRNRKMPEANLKQTLFPEGALLIHNSKGSAPGFEINVGNTRLFALPGVPREMKAMMEDYVLNRIQTLAPQNREFQKTLILKTFGLGESMIQDLIQDLYPLPENEEIGFQFTSPEVHLRLKVKGNDKPKLEETLKVLENKVRDRLGDSIFGKNEDTFVNVIASQLRQSGATLGLAESCTGGLIASLLTKEAGASDYLSFSVVSYSNQAKADILRIPENLINTFGAVSAEVAEAMVKGVLSICNADIGISVTGIAGPDGGSEEKPAGTVYIAAGHRDHPDKINTIRHQFIPPRHRIQNFTAYNALKLAQETAKNFCDSRI